VLVELPTKQVIQVASGQYIAGRSHGNQIIDHLIRHSSSIEQPVNFNNTTPPSAKTELLIRAPPNNEGYARCVSSDYNPIQVSGTLSSNSNLAGSIAHVMFSFAAVMSLVETWAAENNIARVRYFSCNFVGLVLPNDDIETKLHYTGMVSGRKMIKIEATNKETQEKVVV